MSAKEMFEELGYKIKTNTSDFLIYYKEATVNYEIVFVKRTDYNNQKNIEISPTIDGKPHYFTRISMELLQAINKQITELGWNK